MPVTLDSLRRFIPADSPLGRAGGADLLLRATGGNLAGAAALAAIARKESEFGKTSGRFKNNAWGWGVHLGPDVNTAPDWETMAKRVWTGLSGNLYKGSGITNLPDIIMKYAPPSENNTALYQQQMREWLSGLGLDPKTNIFNGGQSITMRPDGPAARASGQAAGNMSSAAKQKMLEALGPAPSLGASLTGALQGGGSQSQNLLAATTGYFQKKKVYEQQKAEIAKLGGGAAKAAAGAEGQPAAPTSDQGGQGIGGSGAVAKAATYKGIPYSWGGGTPAGPTRGIQQGANTVGFDCSGLTENAWASQGVQIGPTTVQQIKTGIGVNARNPQAWQPGDLLFPHPGHVQLYAGNGMVWEAPRTGGHVQLVPARDTYAVVRRPLLPSR